jgi:hypothetical protein
MICELLAFVAPDLRTLVAAAAAMVLVAAVVLGVGR